MFYHYMLMEMISIVFVIFIVGVILFKFCKAAFFHIMLGLIMLGAIVLLSSRLTQAIL